MKKRLLSFACAAPPAAVAFATAAVVRVQY